MTFRPLKRHANGTIDMCFHYRESYRGSCRHQLSWDCESGDCGLVTLSGVSETDEDKSDLSLWCQAEGHFVRSFSTDAAFTLSDKGCCWILNLNAEMNWSLGTTVDMGTRSDTYNLNKSPIIATVPTIRIPQNCFTTLQLLSYDPDGDKVRCRFDTCETPPCLQHPDFSLNETLCTLQLENTTSVGRHIFKMTVEDYPTQDVTLSYSNGSSSVRRPLDLSAPNNDVVPLSQIPLQFAVEIGSAVQTCVTGIMLPQFLSPTPVQGDVLFTSVGQPVYLTLRAQATDSPIFDFQLSGPSNMTKSSFQNDNDGIAQVQVTWTPQESDVYRHVPICFTAETRNSQSEMRCIVVLVEKNTLLSVDADILCTENVMTITLPKDSMVGVEASHLLLKDPTCSLTANDSHIMASVSLQSCGTQMLDTGDYLIFRNEIHSAKETSVITRRNLVRIPFSCGYPKQANVATEFKNHKSDYVFTETGFGSFSYSFDFYSDGTFQSRFEPSSYPIDVKLMDTIYMGIRGHSSVANTQLFVESCRATPDDNPDNPVFYDIIKNGCLMDETIIISPGQKTEFWFQMQAFKFSGEFEEVFMSCNVILCDTESPHSRCAEGCLSESHFRRRREEPSEQTHPHIIVQGPLIIEKASEPVNPEGEVTEAPLSNLRPDSGPSSGTVSFATLFCVALLVLAGVVLYHKQRVRPQDRARLLS